MHELPDGSGFFVAEIDTEAGPKEGGIPGQHPAVMWNPFNKVVQDHRDGTINHRLTNAFRMFAGLPIPWTPAMAEEEVRQPPIFWERNPPTPPARAKTEATG